MTMYTLARHTGVRTFLLFHAPTLVVCIVIAEVFYKFHSFTLECVAFLATWALLDALRSWTLGEPT